MRVVIDYEHCAGNGRRSMLASALFRDDERGYGQVIGDGTIADHQLQLARQVVLACPEEAVTIEDV
jgi:ferredoxin